MRKFLICFLLCILVLPVYATQCDNGYYEADGSCVLCEVGYMCVNGIKKECYDATYQDEVGQSTCKECPTTSTHADMIIYYDNYGHTDKKYCKIILKPTYVTHGYIGRSQCYIYNAKDYGAQGGYCQAATEHGTTKCDGGYHMKDLANGTTYPNVWGTIEDFYNYICTEVGYGYYSEPDSILRFECPAGTTTPNSTAKSDTECFPCPAMDENNKCNATFCNPGTYMPANSDNCITCPNNNYCPGGFYNKSPNAQGIIACPKGLFATTGISESGACGRKLHIGDDVLFTRNTKQTVPSLNIDTDGDGTPNFFLNATLMRTTITSTSPHYLHVGEYYIYDDSVKPTE